MDVFISSGDILDVTLFTTYLIGNGRDKILDLYDQELIREIPEEYLWEYYPTGMKILSDFLGEDYFKDGKHLIDGKLLNVPQTGTTISAKHGLLYRTDWAENLGIEMPTTIEEFHDMLYQFTYNDPDGNGKDDTYGIGGCTDFATQLTPIFGAFGIYNKKLYNQLEDGSVVYTGAMENYREAMKILKQWYDEGIIDPESVTDDRKGLRAKWASGRVGVYGDTATFITREIATGVMTMIIDAFGKDAVGILGPMTCDFGSGQVCMADKIYDTNTNMGVMFSAEATDEQIIAYLKVQEAMASDVNLRIAVVDGEEGVEYEVVDGKKSLLKEITVEYAASRGINDSYYCLSPAPPEYHEFTQSDRILERLDILTQAPTGGIYQGTNITVVSEVAGQYNSEIHKVCDEYFVNVLLGKDNLDDGWDAYIAKLNAAGLDKVIADYEELLK